MPGNSVGNGTLPVVRKCNLGADWVYEARGARLDWEWSPGWWISWKAFPSKAVNPGCRKIRFEASEKCWAKCHFGHRWWWCGKRPLWRLLVGGSGSPSKAMSNAKGRKRWTWFACLCLFLAYYWLTAAKAKNEAYCWIGRQKKDTQTRLRFHEAKCINSKRKGRNREVCLFLMHFLCQSTASISNWRPFFSLKISVDEGFYINQQGWERAFTKAEYFSSSACYSILG